MLEGLLSSEGAPSRGAEGTPTHTHTTHTPDTGRKVWLHLSGNLQSENPEIGLLNLSIYIIDVILKNTTVSEVTCDGGKAQQNYLF